MEDSTIQSSGSAEPHEAMNARAERGSNFVPVFLPFSEKGALGVFCPNISIDVLESAAINVSYRGAEAQQPQWQERWYSLLPSLMVEREGRERRQKSRLEMIHRLASIRGTSRDAQLRFKT